jgi:hypothetical protein
LRKFNINVVSNLAGVGQNMWDHVSADEDRSLASLNVADECLALQWSNVSGQGRHVHPYSDRPGLPRRTNSQLPPAAWTSHQPCMRLPRVGEGSELAPQLAVVVLQSRFEPICRRLARD